MRWWKLSGETWNVHLVPDLDHAVWPVGCRMLWEPKGILLAYIRVPKTTSALCTYLSYFGVSTTDYLQSHKKEAGGCCETDRTSKTCQSGCVFINQQKAPHKERTILAGIFLSFRKSKSLTSLVYLVLGWLGWRGSRGIHPYREWECKSLQGWDRLCSNRQGSHGAVSFGGA